MTRTIAIGDIHGELDHLRLLLDRLPRLEAHDTMVFLGDYIDRGPQSAQVVHYLRDILPTRTPARLVFLRGNHEDAWLRVVREGWIEFVLPAGNGCRECMRSFVSGPEPTEPAAQRREMEALFSGSFFPPDVVAWMRELPRWFEDEHAIYVHAGLPKAGDRWLHPSEAPEARELVWSRDLDFHREYRGKPVICGHTPTTDMPQELSRYTPDDPKDLWVGVRVAAIDTGSGKGGFLSAVELPGFYVRESR
jgi:serine/threonine protein phosphatase 1